MKRFFRRLISKSSINLSENESNSIVKNSAKKHRFLQEINKNKVLYLLTIPGIIWFLVFSYLPMIGIIIAFQNFNPIKGILGSEFVGLQNIRFFFMAGHWKTVTYNTIYLNILFLSVGIIAPVILAISLSEIKNKYFKKVTQSAMILPHFISWAVVAMFAIALMASDRGLINSILQTLGLDRINFYQDADKWPAIFVFTRMWKAAGFSSIIYLATISGIDTQLYEAAKIDGCSKFQSIRYITLPMLKTVIVLMLLFGVGGIFYGDFGMIYTMVGDNDLLLRTTDVIDTYVYRALRTSPNMGRTAAVGLFQSITGFVLVVVSNLFARKYSPDSAIF